MKPILGCTCKVAAIMNIQYTDSQAFWNSIWERIALLYIDDDIDAVIGKKIERKREEMRVIDFSRITPSILQ